MSETCRHTEHAIGRGGRLGRWFPDLNRHPSGTWEPCSEIQIVPDTWALDRDQAERTAAVAALRSAAEAWAGLPEIGGRWTAAGIADWLTIRADLISEGGDF